MLQRPAIGALADEVDAEAVSVREGALHPFGRFRHRVEIELEAAQRYADAFLVANDQNVETVRIVGAVHILDYKPDARTNKPVAQLAIYALALTRLVPGLQLFDIKCAWFNEDEYLEMT